MFRAVLFIRQHEYFPLISSFPDLNPVSNLMYIWHSPLYTFAIARVHVLTNGILLFEFLSLALEKLNIVGLCFFLNACIILHNMAVP